MTMPLKNPSHFMKPLASSNDGQQPYKLLPPSALTIPAKRFAAAQSGPDSSSGHGSKAKKDVQIQKAENESMLQEKETQVTFQPPAASVTTSPSSTTTHPPGGYISYHPPQAPQAQPHPIPPQPFHPHLHPYPHEPLPIQLPHPAPARPATVDTRHLMELQRETEMVVSRQAADIARLKMEVSTQEAQHASELERYRARSAGSKAELEDKAMRLARDLKQVETDHKQKVNKLEEEHQREILRLTEKIRTSAEDFESLRKESDGRIADLSRHLIAEQNSNRETIDLNIKESRLKDAELQKLTHQVAQLKAYIGDALPGSKTSAQWSVEKQNLDKKIKVLEQERDTNKSTIEMLNVRLASLQEIMTIQEKEMGQVQDSAGEMKPGPLLLTKWRERVFALLVQRKSLELVAKKEKQMHEEKVVSLGKELHGAKSRSQILQHALADREAQLELEKKNVSRVEQELVSVQEVAQILDGKLQEREACLCKMRDVVIRCHTFAKGLHAQTTEATAKMASYDQRLSFAVSRVKLLQDLLSRRDTMLKLRLGGSGASQFRETATQVDIDSISPELSDEIQRLKAERDSLVTRLKEDSLVVEERITDMRNEMKGKEETQKEEVARLVAKMQDQAMALASVQEELSSRNQIIEEAREEAVRLKMDLARCQLVAEGASDEKCRVLEAQHTERLAQMEKRLNEARREHAKAVVSLRQLERRSARDRERSGEALASREEQLAQETSRLRSKLSEAEADRNLLMITLRQEGLLGKYRARQTGASPHLQDPGIMDTDTGDAGRTDIRHNVTPTDAAKLSEREPLHAVLKDLQTIAAKVLEDEEEDDDEEEQSSCSHEE